MNKHSSNVKKLKHFLLGAGLVLTLAASTTLAQVSSPVPCAALGGQLVALENCRDAAAGASAAPQFQGGLPVLLQGGLMPCGSLGNKMVTLAECNAADAAVGISYTQTPQFGAQQGGFQQQPGQLGMQGGRSFIPDPNMAASEKSNLEQSLVSGALQAGQIVSCGSAGTKQMSVEDCIKAASAIVAGGSSSNTQFNQQQFGLPQQQGQQMPQSFQNQQSLFGQQQQAQPQITAPAVKSSNVTLTLKGLKLTIKMESTLNSKYKKAKGRTKKLAAVRSIAKKLPKLCRYISSGDDEVDLDESAFDCDEFVAELSEPIGDALKAKDHEVAYESTIAALESFGEVFGSLK